MAMSAAVELRPLIHWSLAEAAGILGAVLPAGRGERAFGPICTDTRRLNRGDFFLALKGENFDGHDFCPEALRRGAAGLIVRHDCPEATDQSVTVLRVDDPLRAYGKIARFQRRAWGGPVIAITGSVGKTTTRRLLADALGRHLNVLEPVRNFNNLVGLPETLLRLEPRHDVAAIELGMNQPGEMERLVEIARPDVAAITRIGRAHLGMFPSMDALVRAKFSIFHFMSDSSPIVVNVGCGHSRRALQRFGLRHPVVSFRADGEGTADVTLENVVPLAPTGYRFDIATPAGNVKGLEFRHFGRHLLEDALAATALLVASGRDPSWIAGALADFSNEPLRGQVVEAGDWTFIMDCYNASPESMIGALRSLAETPRQGRTVVVLADMLELGEFSRSTHDSLLGPLRDLAPDLFFGLGEETSRLAERLAGEGMAAEGFADARKLTRALRESLRAGDRVFFKGAHAFALENVARAVAPDAPIMSRTMGG